MHASETISVSAASHAVAPRAKSAPAGAGFLAAISGMAATFRVAVAWTSHRRAHPADLAAAGFDKEFEERVMELNY